MGDRESNGQGSTEQIRPRDAKTIMEFRDALLAYEKVAIIVGPTSIGEMPSLHKVVFNRVKIPAEEPYIYPTVRGTPEDKDAVYALSYNPSLLMLAQAAGVTWLPQFCGRTDDGRDRDRISMRAAAQWVDLSGQIRRETGEATFNAKARLEELIEKKWKDWYWYRGEGQTKGRNPNPKAKVYPESERDEWAMEQAKRDLLRMQVFDVQRTESSARARAIIHVLALRRLYSREELTQKFFVIPRLVPDIDFARDEFARRALILKTTGVLDTFFGSSPDPAVMNMMGAPAERQQIAAGEPEQVPVTAEVIDLPPEMEPEVDEDDGKYPCQFEEKQPEPEPESDAVGNADGDADQGHPYDALEVQGFRAMTREDQIDVIDYLMATRKYDKRVLQTAPADMVSVHLIGAFMTLIDAPVKEG